VKRDFKSDLNKIKQLLTDDELAIELYSSLCNMRWQDINDPDNIYSCSWRFAGGLVAELRDKGENYMDFYCSGNEGFVSDSIAKMLKDLGWQPLPWGDED
jgi:hypothetical protein